MDRRQRITEELRVAPGTKADLDGRDTRWTGGSDYADLTHDDIALVHADRNLVRHGTHDLDTVDVAEYPAKHTAELRRLR